MVTLHYIRVAIESVGLSFDRMMELWTKIVQVGCSSLRAHSRIMCGPPHKKFADPCVTAIVSSRYL